MQENKGAFGNFLGQIMFARDLNLGGCQIEMWL